MRLSEIYKKTGIRSLPVDPFEAAAALGVKTVDYASVTKVYDAPAAELYLHSRFGFSFRENGAWVIAVNGSSCSERRRRFTVAHELGHCLLEHLDSEKTAAQIEREADRFAADLLSPLSVLNFCGVSSALEISRVCGISMRSAELRYGELSAKRRSAYDFLSQEELRIIKQFSAFASRYLAERACHDSYERYLTRRVRIP